MTAIIFGCVASWSVGWLTATITERSLSAVIVAGLAGLGAFLMMTAIVDYIVS